MAPCSFILMFTRHTFGVWFGGKVGVEQMRCGGNYFELCRTHTHTQTVPRLSFKFVILLFPSVFKPSTVKALCQESVVESAENKSDLTCFSMLEPTSENGGENAL